MVKRLRTGASKFGLPPGTLIHIGDERTQPVKINIIDYNDASFHEHIAQSLEECFQYRDTNSVTWINVVGIHNVGLMEKLGNHYQINPMVMEDIVNSTTRPKVEEAPFYIYTTLKMARYDQEACQLLVEQVSLLISPHVLISFQETEGDVFDSVRERLRNHRGKIRSMGIDHLACSLMDILVDHYFVVLECIGARVEQIEERVMGEEDIDSIEDIHRTKSDLITLRRAMWPMREVFSQLARGEVALFKKATMPYIRDVYDHSVQVVDSIETFRELTSGLLEVQLHKDNQRSNQVMKIMTIMATVFMPLTVVSGIYGMNFKNMPEYDWRYGYPMAWGLMIAMVAGLLIFFRKKKWI